MPRAVDRQQRRDEFVDAFLSIVADGGLEAATSRAVAARGGASVGALWHYFDTFDELLAEASRQVSRRAGRRRDARMAANRGLTALQVLLEEFFPLDRTTQDEARVLIAFWGRVAHHEQLRDVYEADSDEWFGCVRRCLREAVEDGELAASTPVEELTAVVWHLGVAGQTDSVVFHPHADPAQRLRVVWTVLAPHRPSPECSPVRAGPGPRGGAS
ncbi:TetR/AcrR family transcriptional regulator [Kineococcus auxinigenes]|uniref:TetR/AcrR family transcriptional regulator n=1 Tax=unclassified Kineococcus TaxID=2621656 RepID=UPI003D7CCCC4